MKRNIAVMPKAGVPSRAPELELELYRRIFSSTHDAIAIVDANGFYLDQNPAHQRLLGYSDAELNGQTPAIHLGEEAFSRVVSELERTGRFSGELPGHTRDGREIILELQAFTMRDSRGEVICHVGVKRDVTERRHADDELNARLRQQATVARLGQQTLDGMPLQALMQDAVASIAAMLGAEYAKVLELQPDGKHFLLRAGFGWSSDLIGRALVSAGQDSQVGYTLSAQGPVVVEDLRQERRFRGTGWLHSAHILSGISVVLPVHGRPWGVLAAHSPRPRKFSDHDVSFLVSVGNALASAIERSQTEEALEASQQRLQLAQHASNLAVFDWDLEKNEITWSEQLPALRGLASDRRFESWLALVRDSDRARALSAIQDAVKAGTDFDLELPLVCPDGALLWVVSRGQVVCEDGVPRRVLGIVMDITARKHDEELLQRAEKLAMIGRLAASIAHEINNPLESVTNLLYLIENHPCLDDEVLAYARMAAQELNRVSHISRQTLGFYRESAVAAQINAAEVVDDIIRLYARNLEKKRIRVERDGRLEQKLWLYAAEVRQVFSNLLMNAAEACEPGGIITVRLEAGRDWARPEVRGLRLVVADNGHGIERAHRVKIFEPFFTTKGERGTGLGLWVSSGLVQKHGGSIRMRSSTRAERRGTVFTVFLPEAIPAARAKSEGE